ncbi:hypothetical protein CI41S_21230 [Bradyrhizobium ivorense]|nr:hypothetical protein CI41S_21230 [Bradyrhizobium ivorense]
MASLEKQPVVFNKVPADMLGYSPLWEDREYK